MGKHPEEGNIGGVCEKHAPKPNPKFAQIPVEQFLGKFCKLAVVESHATEFMWFNVISLAEHEGQELKGQCYNYPVKVSMRWGDLVEFNRSEIIDITDTTD